MTVHPTQTDDESLTPAQVLLRQSIPAALATASTPLAMLQIIRDGAHELALPVRHGGIDYYDAEQGLLDLAAARGLQTELGHTVVEITIHHGLRGLNTLEANDEEPPPPNGLEDYDLPAGVEEPSDQIAPPTFIRPIDWPDGPIPKTPWVVNHLIPGVDVTTLGGDGGSGKTMAALQLSAALARGAPDWLGHAINPGPVVFLSVEEPQDEIRRRIARIAYRQGFERGDLENLHFWFPSNLGDCTFATPGHGGVMQATPLFRQIEAAVFELKPSLVVLDNVAAVFAGNQNDRVMVRTFVNLFRGMARASGAAILLLDHPSLSGLTNGTGRGGNMDWRNSVRAALVMEAVEGDDQARRGGVLKCVKSNYAPLAAPINLEWVDGVLSPEGTASPMERAAHDAQGEEKFLFLLDLHTRLGIDVRPSPGQLYAPKIFADHPENGGYRSHAFASIMHRLLTAGRLAVEETGPQSKRRKRLVPPQRASK